MNLQDGLRDMLRSGRLRREHIPEDFDWLIDALKKEGYDVEKTCQFCGGPADYEFGGIWVCSDCGGEALGEDWED